MRILRWRATTPTAVSIQPSSGDGKVTTDFFGSYDTANAVAIQTDGKIVAAGSADHGTNSNDFALARYLLGR